MKALRWILFCLVAFGLGTGVAFAMHPPTIGIPKSDASALAGDLSAIKKYAAIGHCDAVRGRLASASRTISELPVSTNATTQRQLTDALATVRSTAISTCQQIADASLPAAPKTPATTPAITPTPTTQATPTPEATLTPTPTPDAGGDATSPSSGGTGIDSTSPDAGNGGGSGSTDSGGGITLPNGVQVPNPNELRHRFDEARQQIQQALNP